MSFARRIARVAVGLGVVGCGSATEVSIPHGVPPRGVLTTDSIGYIARVVGEYYGNPMYQFRIIARYENTTSSPVFMEKCRANSRSPVYSIVRADGPLASGAYNPLLACLDVEDKLIVPPGAVRIDTFVVNGPNAWDGRTKKPEGVTNGRFVLRYGARWNCLDPATCKTPDSLWISNEFTVRTER